MTEYVHSGARPQVGKFEGFDHVTFACSNAKQAASYYCIRFGFEIIAYRGLETGSRDTAAWVVRQNNVTIVLTSPLNPVESELSKQIALSGDHCCDVAFEVADCEALYEKAIQRGGVSVSAPQTLKDETGEVIVATIKTYGNCNHTFVQRNGYSGAFLPGYKAINAKDPVNALLPTVGLQFIDHIVGNQPDNQMTPVVEWYEKVLDFHRFWSVDDSQIHTEFSSLRSIVVADYDEVIKMPINEPAPGLRRSQIEEYCQYHGQGGVQHIAFHTDDIMKAIPALRARGTEFLFIPPKYYTNLRDRLKKSPIQIKEDLDEIERLGILVDFDDKGYLLQLFTKPLEDRPTFFAEILQRSIAEDNTVPGHSAKTKFSFSGFGAGNFKALFESIEREQEKRGNL